MRGIGLNRNGRHPLLLADADLLRGCWREVRNAPFRQPATILDRDDRRFTGFQVRDLSLTAERQRIARYGVCTGVEGLSASSWFAGKVSSVNRCVSRLGALGVHRSVTDRRHGLGCGFVLRACRKREDRDKSI